MKTAAIRMAKMRDRDSARQIKQLNIRIPEIYDTLIQGLARDLRQGMELNGFVVRDPKTGRVKTVTI